MAVLSEVTVAGISSLSPEAEYMHAPVISPAKSPTTASSADLSLIGRLQVADGDVALGQIARPGDHGESRP